MHGGKTQVSPRKVKVRKGKDDVSKVNVTRKNFVSHLGEAEYVLAHPEDVPHPYPDLG